jgi:PST family polysaccharide transporter
MNAVINGLGKFKKVIYITIIGTFLSVLVTVILVFQYQIYGALISIIITPGLLFFVSLFFLLEDFSITTFFKPGLFDWNLLQNLSHYFLMALVSGIFGPLVLLLVRNHLIASVSINAAGYWEAMSRISSYYLLFLNTLITVYYYPKMVLAENDSETKEVIQGFYKHIVPVFGIGLIVVFVLKNILIQLLFTDDFKPVEMLFFWQLIGDFFKGASLILGMQFFAKKMTKTFIVTELISLTILLFSSILLIDYLKTEGVVIAHAITYILYTCVLVVIFRKSLV